MLSVGDVFCASNRLYIQRSSTRINQLFGVLLAKVLRSMESKDIPVSLFMHSQFGGNLSGSTLPESAAVEERMSNLPLKSIVGLAAVSPVCSKSVADADLTWADYTAGGVTTPDCFGTALSSWYAFEQRSCQNCLSVESNVCPNVNNVNDFSGLFSSFKASVKSEAVVSSGLQLPTVQPDKLGVQMSETCQRRFIIFDNSGSKKRIIFHPAIMHEKASMLPYNSTNLGDYLDHLQNVSARAADQLRETMVRFSPKLNIGTLPSRSGVNGREGLQPDFLVGSEGAHLASEAETTRWSYNEGSLAYGADSHEDTEDIEALLSSDDEMSSTGHSPSDVTWHNPLTSSDKYSMDYCHAYSSKKRKREVIDRCKEDDDADSSTASSGIVPSGNLKWSDNDVSHNYVGGSKPAMLKQGRLSCYSEEDLTAIDLNFLDEISSDTKRNKHHKLAYKHGPIRSRKDKIRNTLRMLSGIIPRGDSMDTAIVLDEAIQYVKTLQVEVQKLEARKLM